MSIALPGWLTEVMNLVGVHWPDIEEDDLRAIGTMLDQFAGNMRDHRDAVNGQLQSTASQTTAQSFDALVEHWRGLAHGPLEQSLQTVEEISQGLHVAADLVTVCKTGVIAQLTTLQAEIAAAEATLFGAATIPGLIAVSRQIISQLVSRLEQEAIEKVVNELFGKIVQEIESGISDMVYKGVTGLAHA